MDLQQHWSADDCSPIHLVADGAALCGEPYGGQNGPEFAVLGARLCVECAARSLEIEAAEMRAQHKAPVSDDSTGATGARISSASADRWPPV